MTFLQDAGLAFLFSAPILLANAVPTVMGGGYPIDGYKKLKDGKRIFGDHKTVRGFIAGVIWGFITGIVIWYVDGNTMVSLYGYMGFKYPIWIGLLMGFGANIGDITGSFIKRRLNIDSGGRFPGFDQTGYMIFGLLLSWPAFISIPWQFLVTLLIIAPLLHVLSNIIAYFVKAKDVWW